MISQAWIDAREALHRRYEEAAGLDDASRLGYLQGPTERFSNEEVRALWEQALAKPVSPRESQNQVYVHVPFCKSLCSFCNYERLKPSSPDLLEAWLRRVLGSLETIAPAFRGTSFHALYLGGGTPSVLTPPLFERLLSALRDQLSWHPRAARHIEFDPAVMSREKLEVLARHGFERFSFGVESLDPEVTRAHERGTQTRELISKRFTELRSAGFDDVACDFLAGLAGTTPEGLLAEIEEVLREYDPIRIDLYMLTPTQSYLQSHFGGDEAAFWAHYRRFEEALPRALPGIAERTGYKVHGGHGHHHMLHRGRRRGTETRAEQHFSYQALASQAGRPLHVLGFGPSARSQLFGYANVTARDPEHDRGSSDPSFYEGHRTDLGGECRSFLAHHLRDSDLVSRAHLEQTVGVRIEDVFPEALAVWRTQGLAELDAEGTLRFEPQARRERMRALLWLVPERLLEHEIADQEGLDLSDQGVRRLLGELDSGQALAGGWRTAGIRRGELILTHGDASCEFTLRVAPGLDAGTLRLVPQSATPAQDGLHADLRRSVAVLQRALAQRHRPPKRRRGLPIAP